MVYEVVAKYESPIYDIPSFARKGEKWESVVLLHGFPDESILDDSDESNAKNDFL